MTSTQQRWGRVQELFLQALDQAPDARAHWLENICGPDADLRAEVDSLLECDNAGEGFFENEVQRAVLELSDQEAREPAMEGRQVGSYRLIREIGSGGMGTVYLALRADEQYESEVAIKLVRPGLDTDFILRRFRRERQILARLEHPNITRLFDGGTTEEGIPYLVMEYIEGVWITRYATQQGLSLEDRIRLFMPVCAAVDYAHRNFVVHRDLKPGNILIDGRGTPKLLDFGISKLLVADRPESGNTENVGMMTPDYASPEQVLGEPITILSDVYSLGAVLYELLTGVRPHRIDHCTPLALERAICLDPTIAPSGAAPDAASARRLKGDIDNIVLRAMQKEPERRYASAEHLAQDLRRYLERRPVLARPDSLSYRTGRFLRRNFVAVGFSALALAAILAGAAVAWREARLADDRFQDARKLATRFVFDVDEAAQTISGSTRIRQLITRTGLEYLNRLTQRSSGDWALKRELAAAYIHIGRVQGGSGSSNLGEPAAALTSFQSADRLLSEVLKHSPADRTAAAERMDALHQIDRLQRETAQYKAASEAAQIGLNIAQALLHTNPNDLDAAQDAGLFDLELAATSQVTRDVDAAQKECAEGRRWLQLVATARPDNREAQMNLAESLGRLGSIQLTATGAHEALASFQGQAAVLKALSDRIPSDPFARHELMLSYSHLGDTLGNPEYGDAGDPAGAYQAYVLMAEEARYLHDADPADARALTDYGVALLRLGLLTPTTGPAKRSTLEHSLELLARAAGRNPHSGTIASHKTWVESELAALALAGHDRASGIRYYQMAIATAEGYLKASPRDPSVQKGLLIAVRGLAEEQARMGAREALATLETALRLGRGVDASAPASSLLRITVARAWQTAGSVYTILGGGQDAQAFQDRAAGREWNRRSVEQWRALEHLSGFAPPLRKEMEAAMQAAGASR